MTVCRYENNVRTLVAPICSYNLLRCQIYCLCSSVCKFIVNRVDQTEKYTVICLGRLGLKIRVGLSFGFIGNFGRQLSISLEHRHT